MPKRKTVKPLLIDGQDGQCTLKDSERGPVFYYDQILDM